MLIICNGPYKSGSTILHSLLFNLFFENFTLKKENISPTQTYLNKFEETSSINYVFKTHCYNPTILKKWSLNPNIILLSTRREHHEIINSHYFHFINEKFFLNKYIYLFTFGIIKLIEIKLYENNEEVFCDNIKLIDYNNIRFNTNNTMVKLLNDLNIKNQGNLNRTINHVINNPFSNKSNNLKNRKWFVSRKHEYFKKNSKSLYLIFKTSDYFLSKTFFRIVAQKLFFIDKNRSSKSFL